MTENWTRSDAIRVLGIGLFRQTYKDGPGSLPSNGTMGEIAFEDAVDLLERCPGLRYVLEAGIRAVDGDELFEPWLMTLYAGGDADCQTTEAAIAATLEPDAPPDPDLMTPEQIAEAMVALHNKAAEGWLP